MRPAVDETIRALNLEECDAAAVKLAQTYADAIDATINNSKLFGWSVRWLGPELLKCLVELGATPAARKAVKAGVPVVNEDNPLAKLRAARSA